MSHIILIGKPGSGKGTMSKKIIENFNNYVHLSTGDVFRSHIRNCTELGREIVDIMNSGELVNDELTIAVVEDFIFSNKNKNIIFDGFPRNIKQAEWLVDELQHQKIIVLDIDALDKICTTRIVSRSKIEDRPEDADIKIINKRLVDYDNLTKPIIDWFTDLSPESIVIIDGNQSSEECYQEIIQKLQL